MSIDEYLEEEERRGNFITGGGCVALFFSASMDSTADLLHFLFTRYAAITLSIDWFLQRGVRRGSDRRRGTCAPDAVRWNDRRGRSGDCAHQETRVLGAVF